MSNKVITIEIATIKVLDSRSYYRPVVQAKHKFKKGFGDGVSAS
jgi:hypothetical protein